MEVCRACESSLTPKKNGFLCTKCQTWACSAECERAVVSVQCCRLTGVVSLGSSHSFYSEGPGGSSSSGMPCESENEGQAIDVQIAEVQDEEQPTGRASGRARQPPQIGMATPREGQAALQGNAEAPDTPVGNWTEERMLEPATSLPAMRTIRHQPLGLRQRTCAILKKLQHHTNCHHQWVKRRDSESLKAEPAAATRAWLGPTLLVRAYDGGEHAVDDGLTPGQRRKVSVESAGKRAALAETGAWTELLRLFVRDMLAREVDTRGDGTHTLQQSTTLKADGLL